MSSVKGVQQTDNQDGRKGANHVKWPEVFCYGDSLTQRGYSDEGCWVSLLSNELIRRCDVINRGFSGYNTRWCRMILPKLLDKERARNIVCATVLLGANDSVVKEINTLQHVPVDEYLENLHAIVDYYLSVGIGREKIILIAPPPCSVERYTAFCEETGRVMSKSEKSTQLYAQKCCQVAEECGVEVVDLYSQMKKVDNWSRFLCDGLHFSAEGSKYVFETLWPSIEKRTKDLPSVFPEWKDVDPTNLEKSLEQ